MCGCEYYQELISRMLDEDLSRDERSALAEHLETCRECAAMYQAFSVLSDTLASDMEEPPEGFSDNVMAEIRRSEIIRKNRKPRVLSRQTKNFIVAAACAALVLVTAGGVAIVKNHRTDDAVYESSTTLQTSGNMSTEEKENASVDAPVATTQQPVATTQPTASVPTATPIPDSENYGYVPSQSTAAPTQTPSTSALAEYPSFTPAPGTYATATPTQTPVYTATPAPTVAPTPVPTVAPTPVATPTPTQTPVATPEPTAEQSLGLFTVTPQESEETAEAEQPVETQPPVDNSSEEQNDAATAGTESADVITSDNAAAASENASESEDEKIVRCIDLRDVDTTEFAAKLLVNDSDSDDADTQEDDSTETEMPEASPTPAPDASTDTVHVKTVVSEPAELDDSLKEILPEGIEPERIDVISCTVENEETEYNIIVCMDADNIIVLSQDADGNVVTYAPHVEKTDYISMLDTLIALANAQIEQSVQ